MPPVALMILFCLAWPSKPTSDMEGPCQAETTACYAVLSLCCWQRVPVPFLHACAQLRMAYIVCRGGSWDMALWVLE